MPSSSWTSDNRLWKLDILFWTTVLRNVLFGSGNKPMNSASIVGLQFFQFWIHHLHHLCQLHVIPVQLRCFGTTECFVSKKTLEVWLLDSSQSSAKNRCLMDISIMIMIRMIIMIIMIILRMIVIMVATIILWHTVVEAEGESEEVRRAVGPTGSNGQTSFKWWWGW